MTAPCDNDNQNAALKEVGKLRKVLAEMVTSNTDTEKTVNAYWFFVLERGLDPCDASAFVIDELEKSYRNQEEDAARKKRERQWRRLECH